MKAKFTNSDHSLLDIFDDSGNLITSGVVEQNPLWAEAAKIATHYVSPVIDPKVARANALASLDPLVAQITRYELLGIDASISKAKLTAKVAEIDAEFPNA